VAGLELHVRLGDLVQRDTPLLTLHARAPGELAYAKRYLASHPVVSLGPVEAP
jgi:thymidine phosphorylase